MGQWRCDLDPNFEITFGIKNKENLTRECIEKKKKLNSFLCH